MTNELDKMLEDFSHEFWEVSVRSKLVDLTECFRNHRGELFTPKNFGDLERNVVMGYVAANATFVEKYQKDEEGNLVYANGRYQIREFDTEMKIMTCLCLKDMKSISWHEIYEPLKQKRHFQGFRNWQIKNIKDKICIDPNIETAFIFCNNRNRVYQQAELHRIWLDEVCYLGSRFLKKMSHKEAKLMEGVFPEQVLAGDEQAIKERSYMYGRDIHTPESVEFLRRKVETYQKFKTTLRKK